jgi:hypothetical protein
LDKTPPEVLKTGLMMIGIDGKHTKDQMFASLGKNGNLSDNLSILSKAQMKKSNLHHKALKI